jgi:hypothetical protein
VPDPANRARTPRPEPITATLPGGYVLTETAEYRLRTISDAMLGIAHLTEGDQPGRDLPEVPPGQIAAIFRVMAQATDSVRREAGFSFDPITVRLDLAG